MRIWITGGRIIDPGRFDGPGEVLIDEGRIVAVMPPQAAMPPPAADRVIDAAGWVVVPGLIDIHVHLREPGFEHKETIASGCRAAAAGGFTSICCMPNTRPVVDNRETVEWIVSKAAAAKAARVYPVAAISRGLDGRSLCAYDELKAAGAVALTDDGYPVMNSLVMRRAMEAAHALGLPVISHSEDLDLADGGAMNEGPVARRLGYKGIPNAVESIAVMRDIALCELTGCALHIAHVSTAQSVAAIRRAKADGLSVTAETAPHYFALTDEAVAAYGANAKMNPPLRSEADREAIVAGLQDGTIDAIATDHAPHAIHEKAAPFPQAPNGIIGLESALAVSLRLVEQGKLELPDLIAKMTTGPARIVGLTSGLQAGQTADLTLIDAHRQHTIDASTFASLSRNTPFDGWQLSGKAVVTIVAGKIVHEVDDAQENNKPID